jgi:hypothetical protein
MLFNFMHELSALSSSKFKIREKKKDFNDRDHLLYFILVQFVEISL